MCSRRPVRTGPLNPGQPGVGHLPAEHRAQQVVGVGVRDGDIEHLAAVAQHRRGVRHLEQDPIVARRHGQGDLAGGGGPEILQGVAEQIGKHAEEDAFAAADAARRDVAGGSEDRVGAPGDVVQLVEEPGDDGTHLGSCV